MHRIHNKAGKPLLYVVATPIGNLQDITLRALEVLKQVDVVAAEDTRVTSRLLRHFQIPATTMVLREHTEKRIAEKIVALLQQGKSVALVSDAGTPGISDPGAIAVSRVRQAGYRVVPVPGANAAVSALSVSGTQALHFLYYGFLPSKASARRRELENLKSLPFLLIFYEAPHRILESIADMQAVFGGERGVTIARELTKLFEDIYSGTLDTSLEWLGQDKDRQKGEFVVLVSGAGARNATLNDVTRLLTILLHELPLKQAVKLASQISGANRKTLYAAALQIKGNP
ncbi:MAG TPA: 16S rRNA (cytidine(1402)-2'-O)-methyltransferase [Burkholderiales bacterium]|nr:16S rRNA (cytidine(1402)-2'-O)-methyltransferase [Burkholderiales bacterium]